MKLIILLFAFFSVAFSRGKVSLQWAICEANPQDTLPKLGLDAATPPYKENPITYYDEQPPFHAFSGVGFRTKTNKGKPLSAIKVRLEEDSPDIPDFVDCGWARYGNTTPFFACEKRCLLKQALSGDIWCEEQVELAQKYEHVDWSALHAYGPYPNGKWKLRIGGHKAKFDDVVAGNLHLMEIEMKVHADKADAATEAVTQYLMERGIALCEPQEGKFMRLIRSMGYVSTGEDEL